MNHKGYNMKKIQTLLLSSILVATAMQAGWQDQIGGILETVQKTQSPTTPTSTASSNVNLSNNDMSGALKEALSKGVKFAVSDLGKDGGYLNNPLVKIPLPKSLQTSEKLIRKLGGGKYVDDLILSLNKAAEEAAPKTVDVFMNSIQNMTITDAKTILAGADDSATQYFRKNSSAELASVIAPIVEKSMANNDVSKYYGAFQSFYKKNAGALQNESVSALTSKFGLDAYLPSQKDEDLSGFVTNKSIDGLMSMIAQKEKGIRDNPLMRNSDLLQKVFGAF